MSSSYKVTNDLNEAKAMVDSLEDYVRGEELYGHADGGFFSKMPSLTVGALVMRLRRLEALRSTLKPAQVQDLDSALNKWESVRKDWMLHYEQKVVQEIESRLNSMQTFFRECADSMQNCENNYRPEIQKRTIVQELLTEMDALKLDKSDITDLVDTADSKLRGYMRPDEFQWASELEAVYPKNEYWWLYQKPPKATEEE